MNKMTFNNKNNVLLPETKSGRANSKYEFSNTITI